MIMRRSKFEIFDKFYNAHWFLTGYSCRYFSELLREGGARSITTFVGVMEHGVNSMIFKTDEFNRAGNYYADKLINDHAWRRRMYRRHQADLKKYFGMSERLRRLPFSEMTDEKIVALLKPILKQQERVRVLGVMLNGLVLDGRNHLSNKLRAELRYFFAKNDDFDKCWPTLTQVTKLSMRQRKDIAVAKLAHISKRLSSTQRSRKLKGIYNRYCWLDYMYYGPATPWPAFRQEFLYALKDNRELDLPQRLQVLAREQRGIMRRVHFTPRAKLLVKIAQHVLWQKAWRKDVEYHGFYCYESMLREIAKRKGERDWRNLLYMFPWEFEGFVKLTKPTLNELHERRAFSILIVKGPSRVEMLTGTMARKVYHRLRVEKNLSHIRIVSGQCAVAGKVIGRVRIVQVPDDMAKMSKGDILISQATSPDLLSAMKKAAAIVTNTGGLICHAAITARELNIPCVVGTTNATLVFRDGDRVEVDATRGRIKKI